MDEQIVTAISRQLDRRRFLRGVASLTASVVLGMFGLAQSARAFVSVKCCTLCYASSGSCHGTCSGNNIWCWFCDSGGVTYGCCEKFAHTTNCNNQDFCGDVLYSCLWRTGFAPAASAGTIGAA
jgi:hypothetical protein